MPSVATHLRSHDGVLPFSALERAGFTRSDLRSAMQDDGIIRVRNGWFAVPDAHADLIAAVRVGGTATATTVAKLHRLWVADDDRLHVRVRHSTGRLSSPGDRSVPLDRTAHRACVHYSTRGGFDRARDPLTLALAEMFACSDDAAVLAAIDSGLETRSLELEHLDEIRQAMPRTRRAIVDMVDPESQSGLETKVRLLLRSKRIRFRAQAYIEDVGWVDFLVGDRLVIEVDGRAFHTGLEFETDRRRDFELVLRGYVVLRLSYRQVMGDWERTRAAILELVARGEHRWSRRGPHAPALPPSVFGRPIRDTDA
ncbi:endonuclease domain-containing protein [Agromyces sp. NPDC056523]|uniref:endonuclease domain-containing protein n=1 Tax=Agromyces sp. NPDC056523 TaxID=3345850 RepID=UPI00366CCA87